MKKFLIVSSLFVTLLIIPGFVFAETRGQERRADIKAVTEVRRQEKIREFFNKMMDRFETATLRLEKLIARIQSRIDKIEADDSTVDTTSQQTQLNTAKTKLDEAKDKIQILKDEFETLLTSDEPKVVFKKVGLNVRNLKQDLVKVHGILVRIIGELKGLKNED